MELSAQAAARFPRRRGIVVFPARKINRLGGLTHHRDRPSRCNSLAQKSLNRDSPYRAQFDG